MIQVRIKRVYEDFSEADGYRVLVDKLWPRGIKKEWLRYDYWAKDITPSAALRKWFHDDRAFAAQPRDDRDGGAFTMIYRDTGMTSSYCIRKSWMLLWQRPIFWPLSSRVR